MGETNETIEQRIARLEFQIVDAQQCIVDLTTGKLEVTQASPLEPDMSLVHKRVNGIEESLNSLNLSVDQHIDGAQHSENPTIRIRMNFSPPTKDRGWNCEQTVEVDGLDFRRVSKPDCQEWVDLANTYKHAYAIGEDECRERDRAEARSRKRFA